MNPEIRNFIKNEIAKWKNEKVIPLNVPSYGVEEIEAVLECLLKNKVTMGEKVREFEARFASYIGVSFAIATNSGGHWWVF